MRAPTLCLVTAALLACSTPAVAGDELCKTIQAFERSKPQHANERTWFEYHWGFARDSFWSWGCRHSRDEVAKATCQWLLENTSREFSMMLPHSIMQCYGYRFPRFSFYDWASMAGTIRLRGSHGTTLVMDLNYRDLPNGEVGLRVSREVPGRQYEPEDLPPIEPFPSREESPSGQ
jgi:hypothetical protein